MKNISQTLKSLTIALILVGGISYVFAWTGPSTTPPNGNVSAPINIGSTSQSKNGALSLGTSNPPTTGYSLDVTGAGVFSAGVASNQFCLGTNCITSWPSGGGGGSCSWKQVRTDLTQSSYLSNGGTGSCRWTTSDGNTWYGLMQDYHFYPNMNCDIPWTGLVSPKDNFDYYTCSSSSGSSLSSVGSCPANQYLQGFDSSGNKICKFVYQIAGATENSGRGAYAVPAGQPLATCPAGFYVHQVLGYPDLDGSLFLCLNY